MRSFLSFALLFAVLALALAGCAAGHGWAMLLTTALSFSGLVLAGCGSSHRRDVPIESDGGQRDTGPDVADADVDAGGTWEACCVEGTITTCFCPAGWACNYGWFTDCGDGTCEFPGGGAMCAVDGGPPDAGPTDAGPADAGGHWESCCVDGMVSTCFCPAGLACNYGWYTDCGGGTCIADPTATCPVDAGSGA